MNTLSIHTFRPTIEVCSQKAMLEIKSRHTRRMKIKTIRPQMKVERNGAGLSENRAKPRVRVVKKPLDNFIRYLSDTDIKKLSDLNGNLKDEQGEGELAPNATSGHLQTYFSVKAALSELNAQTYERNEASVADPGKLTIEWTTGEVIIEWEEEYLPQITVTPYEVLIRLKGEKGVKIHVNEEKIPLKKGRKINKNV